ncbi:MAG: MarR family transcriptional regulator [Alphaproteobacteria bacterium]|nr:MarR family transcriptional regulator [Alphaproteobacteria bacterium]
MTLPRTRENDRLADPGGKEALRLWLRLLDASRLIEDAVSSRLRDRYGVSLARFDLLAVLYAAENGLTMGDIGRRLRVTGGNVTGLVDRLEKEGLAARRPHPTDRRAFFVALTAKGRRDFASMAQEHEGWVQEILAGVNESQRNDLTALLASVRASAMDAEAHWNEQEAR